MDFMKIYFLSLLLLSTVVLNAQKSICPKDVTEHCSISKKDNGTIRIECSKLSIDLNGPRGEYEILKAVKDKRRFNLICKARLKNKEVEYLILITANKINGKWSQRYGKDISPPIKLGKKQKIIEYFFSDMNTLYLAYELEESQKKGFLLRFTNDRGLNWYIPSFDPFAENLYFTPDKILNKSPRPKY